MAHHQVTKEGKRKYIAPKCSKVGDISEYTQQKPDVLSYLFPNGLPNSQNHGHGPNLIQTYS